MEISGRKFLIVGFARSGQAAARFLLRRGASVAVTDVRTSDSLKDQLAALPSTVEAILGEHRLEDFVQADCVVLSPGVPASLPQVRQAMSQGVEVISEVELAYRFLNGTIVGITGSNGKTTTVTLLAELLKTSGIDAWAAGNIGKPLISFAASGRGRGDEVGTSAQSALAGAGHRDRVYVAELSSFQLETIRDFRCACALLLNITPDHLDRYPSFDHYRQAKERIFLNQQPQDWAVLNADDPLSIGATPRIHSRTFPFSRRQELKEGVFLRRGRIVCRLQDTEQEILAAAEVRLKGSHNLENALAAVAAGRLMGAEPQAIAETLRRFRGVEHRLEHCARHQGVDYYNDSKATNPDSALKAVEAFDSPLIVIMGGFDKGAGFDSLRPSLARHAKQVILIGATAARMQSDLSGAAPLLQAGDLETALHAARDMASSGDTILLAPACASFDQFEDYEHRGREFKRLVQALAQSGDPAAEPGGTGAARQMS